MKFSEQQLKKLVRDVIKEEMQNEDFKPNQYKNIKDIERKYWTDIAFELNLSPDESGLKAIKLFKMALRDAYQLGRYDVEADEFSDKL